MNVKSLLIDEITVGSDIEYLLKNEEGEVVSAEGIIQGTKWEPHHFDPDNEYYATSLDNVLAEGNIPPVTNPVDFYLAIEKLRNYIDNVVRNQNLHTFAFPSARYAQKYLETENARTYGCSPSVNAWTKETVYPEAKQGDNNRAAGFHLHLGYSKPNEETNYKFIQACDLTLGIPSVLMEPVNERRSTGYGHAGNMRHTRFGVEYRTLSSYFANNKELIEWAYRNFVKATDFVNSGIIDSFQNKGNEIQKIINTENKDEAYKLVKELNLEIL